MDIAYSLKEMRPAFDGTAREAALEHRANVAMPTVKALSMGRVQSAHRDCQIRQFAGERRMDMIAQQTSCMDRSLVFGRVSFEPRKIEVLAVIISEELAPPGSSRGHME